MRLLQIVKNSKIQTLLVLIILFSFSGDTAISDVIPDIYVEGERNFVASTLCKAIDLGMVLMTPLFAFMFSVLGLKAYQGELKWSVFFTFATGIAIFKAAGPILEFVIPDVGLKFGCKCATTLQIRDANGKISKYDTGLNEDCTEK